MRRFNFFTATAFCVAILSSCAGNERLENDVLDNELKPVQVKFGSTNIAAMQTKVHDTEWEGGEHIGIFMVEHGTTTIVPGASNVEYVNADGAAAAGASVGFTPAGDPICYPVSTTDKVDFIAYHPYKALSNTWEYAVNVQTQTNQSAIDFMKATANAGSGYDKNSGTVNLDFYHYLAKIEINVTAGDGVSNLSGLAVTITDQPTEGTLDIVGNTLVGGTIADITALTNGAGTQAEAILFPGSTGAIKFEFAVDGVTYEADIPASSVTGANWASGYKYIYTVILSRNAVEIQGTAQPWTDGGTDTATGYPQ